MQEYLKSWNTFEKVIFVASVVFILGLGLVLKCDLLIPMVFDAMLLLINDVYGFKSWAKS